MFQDHVLVQKDIVVVMGIALLSRAARVTTVIP